MNIKAQFSDMIPNLANIMQFADVSLHCCKILSDGNAPCNELMLHHTMQCTGASCKMLQIPSNFAANIAQPRDSKSKRAKDCTQILSHRGACIKTCFLHNCTYTCFYPGVVLHTNTFRHRCCYIGMFLRKKLLHADAWVLVHTGAFAQRCFYRGMLLHARAFTQGFF